MSTRARDQQAKREAMWKREVVELLKQRPHLSIVRQTDTVTEVLSECPFCPHSHCKFALHNETIVRWLGQRELIQNLLPDLDEDRAELLISGTCPTCWEKMGEDDS